MIRDWVSLKEALGPELEFYATLCKVEDFRVFYWAGIGWCVQGPSKWDTIPCVTHQRTPRQAALEALHYMARLATERASLGCDRPKRVTFWEENGLKPPPLE